MATVKDAVAPEEEQVKLLEEAKNVVKSQGFQMKRCLDGNNLMDALKHASNMICELRTSLLSPKNYYALYIEAFDQLRHLETYLLEEKHGKKMAELYELVQYAGNILPRLYLLATVGSVYVKLKEAPAKDVLRDLVEMCRGVQHPTRGLFLRTYLSEMVKDKLPDTGSEYEGKGGVAQDAVDFVLVNFTEMNKLWVRLQYQGHARDKEKREAERSELRLLVGKNIARLSQLDGVDVTTYQKSVLPKLIDQIVSCKDLIAQQYLMECIIQVFPDEFHLQTLEPLLGACSQLIPPVKVKTIVVSLIERLINFSSRESIPSEIPVFEVLNKSIRRIVELRPNMPLEEVLDLQSSLLNLAMTCYPSELSFVDQVFKFCAEYTETRGEEKNKNACADRIITLLNSPLQSYHNIVTVLEIENYASVIQLLSHENKKRIAVDIARNCSEYPVSITTSEDANKLLGFIEPLIKDESDATQNMDEEDFEIEQNLVAGLVHLFNTEDPDQLFLIYNTIRKHFGQGGQKRIKYTLPPLLFRVLKLALKYQESEEDCTNKTLKVFKFAHEIVTALSSLSQLSLRLFLQCALASDKCGSAFETITYEFFTQAFVIYEEQISESIAQFQALTLIIGSLQQVCVFTEDNYETLITKSALHASRLLKKPDQCRAVYLSSHLFWSNNPRKEYGNSRRVLECLQKALRIADVCMDASMNIHLFVEIFNRCLYYFENECETVTGKYVSGMIELINTNIANNDATAIESANAHYKNTLDFIQSKCESSPRYKEIEI